MKKILAIALSVVMLLSLSAILVSARTTEGIDVSFTPGAYCVESAEEFSTVGDVTITWDKDAASKLTVTDGDMSDWQAANYPMITVDASNMVSWQGNLDAVPAGWSISTYFVADSEWLYIGFYVTDPDFVYGTNPGAYNGDAFQVCIDFGGKLGWALENDPELLSNPKNIFYSFTCIEDGAPLQIQRQESDNDALLSEANGDGVKGAAKKTENGWSAEFALSFSMLYADYQWKAYEEDTKLYVGGPDELPLNIGCCLYYLDRTTAGGVDAVNWAAGSSNGITDKDSGAPVVSWTAWDNGINLVLPYQEGLEFADPNLVVIPNTETIPEEESSSEPESEPESEPTSEPESESASAPAESESASAPAESESASAPAESGSAAESETKAEEKSGCGATVLGSVAVLMSAMAAAVVLKKKD
ncbi:MAG: hypothetical protein J6D87_09585 [Clostridia bacterium]|nr:hypothetical protein [Clostridia bacterium]